VPTTSRDVAAWCSSADLTRDTDAQGNPRPAHLRVCSAGHGSGQVLESRNELPTAVGKGMTLHAGEVPIDTTAVTGGYTPVDSTVGSGKALTCNLNGATSGCTSATTTPPKAPMSDADNVWGNVLKSDAGSAAADAHW
jgi:hypothetical protein